MNTKNKIILVVLISLIVGLILGYLTSQSKANFQKIKGVNSLNKNNIQESIKNTNKNNCLSDDCLSVDNLNYPIEGLPEEVKKALNKAIEDEYKAYTVYNKTIEKFGMVRPFSMIIRAEENHIASLKSLFDKYGLEIPVNNWGDKVFAESSIKDSCKIGVTAEIDNAKLYREELLPLVKNYEDITIVFTNLMNASQEKHLPAFEKCD
jgi:hypothetical protein